MSATLVLNKKNPNELREIINQNKLFDFFLFDKSGVAVLEKQFNVLFPDMAEYNKYKLLIKNISHTLLLNRETKSSVGNPTTPQDNEKLNLNKFNNNNDNDFVFKSFQNDKCKLLFMVRNTCILVGVFPKTSSTQFQRFLLVHIFLALINFKGDFFNSL